jgi:hypothetical protein
MSDWMIAGIVAAFVAGTWLLVALAERLREDQR